MKCLLIFAAESCWGEATAGRLGDKGPALLDLLLGEIYAKMRRITSLLRRFIDGHPGGGDSLGDSLFEDHII